MQWRTPPQRHFFGISLFALALVSVLLSACGSNNASQHVTLTFSSWQGGAAGDAYQGVIKSFEQAHSNITIQYQVAAAADYTTLLNTHFGAGDAADIVAFSPTSFNKAPYVKAGNLLDLSDQPWVAHIQTAAKVTAASDADPSKIYALPTVQDIGGVIYNKDIFTKYNLQVPTTWAQFLQVCATLKAAGVAPITVGAKDGWPLEQFLYNMLANTVYRDDPSFSAKQTAGSATYSGSAGWKQALTDLVGLQKAGYFNDGFSSTDFAGTQPLLATGKAAMEVNGDYTLAPTEADNANIHLGLFPLPYGITSASTAPNLTTSVDVTLGISAKSQHVAEAKEFLQYFAQPDVMASFLNQRQGLGVLDNVSSYKVDPALTTDLPLLGTQAVNEAVFGTTSTVETTMWKDAQAILTGTSTPDQMLQDMDQAYKGH